jgi:hypothetical protein
VWTQSAKLGADDADTSDQFGYSVAMVGDTALIGAYGDDCGAGGACGAAYVFERDGAGVWTQSAKLVADDAAPNDQFGSSVAVSDGLALVGAPRDECSNANDCGAAYVFDRDAAGNWSWTRQAKLVADDAIASGYFGQSIALSGSSALVGSPHARCSSIPTPNRCGGAYVFDSGGLGGWTQFTKLSASDGANGDQFGISVALAGDVALVGAFADDCANGGDCGAAYIMSLLP